MQKLHAWVSKSKGGKVLLASFSSFCADEPLAGSVLRRGDRVPLVRKVAKYPDLFAVDYPSHGMCILVARSREHGGGSGSGSGGSAPVASDLPKDSLEAPVKVPDQADGDAKEGNNRRPPPTLDRNKVSLLLDYMIDECEPPGRMLLTHMHELYQSHPELSGYFLGQGKTLAEEFPHVFAYSLLEKKGGCLDVVGFASSHANA